MAVAWRYLRNMRTVVDGEAGVSLSVHHVGPVLVVQRNLHESVSSSLDRRSHPLELILEKLGVGDPRWRSQLQLTSRIYETNPQLVLEVGPLHHEVVALHVDLGASVSGTLLGVVVGDVGVGVEVIGHHLSGIMHRWLATELLSIKGHGDLSSVSVGYGRCLEYHGGVRVGDWCYRDVANPHLSLVGDILGESFSMYSDRRSASDGAIRRVDTVDLRLLIVVEGHFILAGDESAIDGDLQEGELTGGVGDIGVSLLV
mmetsp:Transcript_30095/g.45984  ORF Transcript_30095/g.45984 Transcript_30095/m.45984 type:complete len:257 (+) Transcript_30095:199-969(+)